MKKLIFLSLSLLLLLILMPGCFSLPAPSTTLPVATPSVIGTFSSNPSTINSGGISTLLWNVSGATSVSIDQGIGLVDVAGSRTISPAVSTVYTITAINSAGTVTGSTTTTVNPVLPTQPAIIEFSNNPSTINPGGTSTLLWNVSGATSVSIDQGVGLVGVAGSRIVSPAVSTIYTITASNSAGIVTRSTIITVNSVLPTPPVIIEFSNYPSTINPGGISTLLWNVSGATSVSIDQGIGLVDVAGSRVVSPATSTVYTISATNSSGVVIRSSTIIIVSTPMPEANSNPVISFTAQYIGPSDNYTNRWQLNWNVSNATQIVIQPDVGTVNRTGSVIVTLLPGQTKLYRLEAVNDWGWAYWQIILQSPNY